MEFGLVFWDIAISFLSKVKNLHTSNVFFLKMTIATMEVYMETTWVLCIFYVWVYVVCAVGVLVFMGMLLMLSEESALKNCWLMM
jgi:hypothetical protein